MAPIPLSFTRLGNLRQKYFPFSKLTHDANVLIFPDVQSGDIALHLFQYMTETVTIGPLLTGTRLPAHLRQYGVTAQQVVNLTIVGVVEAATAEGRND